MQQGASVEDALAMLNKADSWHNEQIQVAGRLEGLARQDAIRDLFAYAARLDTFTMPEFKLEMAKVGVQGRAFNELLKAVHPQEQESDAEMPEILNGDIPILSPALGFQRDLAIVPALDLLTQGNEGLVWIRASILREQVAKLLNQPIDQLGHTQWIAHLLKRLHLLDETKRKRDTDGMIYAIHTEEVRDMMRRYEVSSVIEMNI